MPTYVTFRLVFNAGIMTFLYSSSPCTSTCSPAVSTCGALLVFHRWNDHAFRSLLASPLSDKARRKSVVLRLKLVFHHWNDHAFRLFLVRRYQIQLGARLRSACLDASRTPLFSPAVSNFVVIEGRESVSLLRQVKFVLITS